MVLIGVLYRLVIQGFEHVNSRFLTETGLRVPDSFSSLYQHLCVSKNKRHEDLHGCRRYALDAFGQLEDFGFACL